MHSKEQILAYFDEGKTKEQKEWILKHPAKIKSSKGKHGKHLQPKKKKRK